jgi:hypothetical protein
MHTEAPTGVAAASQASTIEQVHRLVKARTCCELVGSTCRHIQLFGPTLRLTELDDVSHGLTWVLIGLGDQ